MAELNSGEFRRKATLQHYLTILAKRVNGEPIEEIAKSLKMEERSVQRDLEYVKNNWSGRTPANAPQPSVSDLMPKTSCTRCNDTIEEGEYRVAVAVTEIRPDEAGGKPRRGPGGVKSFCDVCVATAETFEFRNPWKKMIELDAQSARESSPSSEDAFHRSVTGRGGKESDKGATAYVDPQFDQNDDGLGQADKESVEFSEYVGPGQAAIKGDAPLIVRTGESIRKETLSSFLKNPASRGTMKTKMREAASLYLEGMGQSDIARKLNVDQGTVSRMIQGALKLANDAR